MDGWYVQSRLIAMIGCRDGSSVGTPCLRFHLSASGDEIAIREEEGRDEGLDASSEGRHGVFVGAAIVGFCLGVSRTG